MNGLTIIGVAEVQLQIVCIGEIALLQVWQQPTGPTVIDAARNAQGRKAGRRRARGGDYAAHIDEVMTGKTELPHVVAATHAAGGFASGLHGRQEQSNEHADDGNYDQKLDEREARHRAIFSAHIPRPTSMHRKLSSEC